MKTKAVRMYGRRDLRLEEFELPAMKDDEILGRVVSDAICLSSYKAAGLGPEHLRVPDDIAENPVMVGHELCGEIVVVGERWKDRFAAGAKFTIQPALNYQGSYATPGYSYPYIGGAATNILLPPEVMAMDCLLAYDGDSFFLGSLAEPLGRLRKISGGRVGHDRADVGADAGQDANPGADDRRTHKIDSLSLPILEPHEQTTARHDNPFGLLLDVDNVRYDLTHRK